MLDERLEEKDKKIASLEGQMEASQNIIIELFTTHKCARAI